MFILDNRFIKKIAGIISINTTEFVFRMGNKSIIGKFILFIYKHLLKILNLSLFPIENYETYNFKVHKSELIPIAKKRIGIFSDVIMANRDSTFKFNYKSLPDLLLLKSYDVNIRGDSDVIVDINNNCVISDVSYNINPNISVVDGLLYRTKKNVCILRDCLCKPKEQIESGIMISGKFSTNYYHTLFENLIKLLYIEKSNIPKEVPIIIDYNTMEICSLKSICELLTKHLKRKIITIKSDKIYHFKTLYSINRVNLIPPHLIKNYSNSIPYLYWAPAIIELRNILLSEYRDEEFPKRIFITRSSVNHRNFNENEVYNILEKYNFKKIAPETLSFKEQMSLFHNAEYIVSGSGAALTNLLFVTEKCSIICFGISNKGNETSVFNTIANINGASFTFFPRKTNENGNVHSNFEVDCSLLDCMLKKIIN